MADVQTYVELEEVKKFLSIDNNNEDDILLDTLILDANQEIELRLTPYAESFPLTEQFFEQATKARDVSCQFLLQRIQAQCRGSRQINEKV